MDIYKTWNIKGLKIIGTKNSLRIYKPTSSSRYPKRINTDSKTSFIPINCSKALQYYNSSDLFKTVYKYGLDYGKGTAFAIGVVRRFQKQFFEYYDFVDWRYIRSLPLCWRMSAFIGTIYFGKKFVDLLYSNPLLACCLIDRYFYKKNYDKKIKQLLNLKQYEIINHLSKKSDKFSSKSMVKLTKKIRPKVPLINIHIHVNNFPYKPSMKNFLGTLLSNFVVDENEIMEIINIEYKQRYPKREHAQLLVDSFRNIKLIKRHKEKPIKLSKCESIEEWHDKLAKQAIKIKDKPVDFPSQWLPNNDKISYIPNSQKLQLEGSIMHHCVYGYKERILNEHCQIYHYSGSQEATIEVTKLQKWDNKKNTLYYDDAYQIQQIRSRCNSQVDSKTKREINAWFYNWKTEEETV